MKKQILLPLVLGLGLLIFANSAKSQSFQIVASFGTTHSWVVPNAILYEIDYYYPYHQIVHINRESRGRQLYYNVLLEQHGQFVEVFFGRQAIILDINYYHNYPLAQHICNGHCGYHGNFYKAHHVVCNHRNHGHNHHANYNHVAYRSNTNHNTYAARSSAANRNVSVHYANNISRKTSNNTSRSTNSRTSSVRTSSPSSVNVSSSRGQATSSRVEKSDRKSTPARSTSTSTRSSSSRSSQGRTSKAVVSVSSRSRN